MKTCEMEVMRHAGGLSIWCNQCHTSVAWDTSFTVEQIAATAQGHRAMMDRARQVAKFADPRRTKPNHPLTLDMENTPDQVRANYRAFIDSADVPDYER